MSPLDNPAIAQLVSTTIANHTPEELALGYIRYEVVRRLTPQAFGDIYRGNLAGARFDDLIDGTMTQFKPEPDSPPPPIHKPVKCCRCKLIQGEDDRVEKPCRNGWSFDLVCRACGCKTFYRLRADGKPCRTGDTPVTTWPPLPTA